MLRQRAGGKPLRSCRQCRFFLRLGNAGLTFQIAAAWFPTRRSAATPPPRAILSKKAPTA
jgi:hypothetical protein